MLGYRSARDDRFNSHRVEQLKGASFLVLSLASFGVSLLSVTMLTISLLQLFGYNQSPGHRRFILSFFSLVLIHSIVLGCFAFQFGIRHLRTAHCLRPIL